MAGQPPPLERRIAQHLLDIGAVSFSDAPYTWASGIRSPIYCDNRLTMAYPAVREEIAGGFAFRLQELGLRPDIVVGTATAGIPHAAWLAQRLGLPMAYVRSSAKAHGRGRQVEGVLREGDRVVVIEDLISTGGSSAAAVEAVRSAGAEVLAVLAIFSYGLAEADEQFRRVGVGYHTLTNFEALIEVGLETERLNGATVEALRTWREDPWSFTS